jgi:hypothetical protein
MRTGWAGAGGRGAGGAHSTWGPSSTPSAPSTRRHLAFRYHDDGDDDDGGGCGGGGGDDDDDDDDGVRCGGSGHFAYECFNSGRKYDYVKDDEDDDDDKKAVSQCPNPPTPTSLTVECCHVSSTGAAHGWHQQRWGRAG